MKPRTTILMSLMLGASLPGCLHVHHSNKNQPGHANIRQPPTHLEIRTVEDPQDPGEHRVWLTYGILVGGGLSRPQDGPILGSAFFDPELSLHFNESSRSHLDDVLLTTMPSEAFGLNLGWAPYLNKQGFHTGPLYLEAQYRRDVLRTVSVGWAADFLHARHGPQATASLGPLYGRITHLFGGETTLHLGLIFKSAVLLVQSR